MSGTWVLVCGPSGAGKDTLLAAARAHLADDERIVFAERWITRPRHPASDHRPATDAEFDRLLAGGAFALHWQAHGHRYGVARAYAAQVAAGRTVVVNGSRAHLAELRAEQAQRLCAVQIVAPAADIAARLVARSRESAEAIAARLHRNRELAAVPVDACIANDGDPAQAAERLVRFIRACAARRQPTPATAD